MNLFNKTKIVSKCFGISYAGIQFGMDNGILNIGKGHTEKQYMAYLYSH